MILIDADKLRIEVVREGRKIHTPHVSLDQLLLVEEVKAIPIEWIKDKMDELEGTGRFELSEYLDELLEDWEKENDSK